MDVVCDEPEAARAFVSTVGKLRPLQPKRPVSTLNDTATSKLKVSIKFIT